MIMVLVWVAVLARTAKFRVPKLTAQQLGGPSTVAMLGAFAVGAVVAGPKAKSFFIFWVVRVGFRV